MISLFIKSYEKDFKWLNYCLKSIDRFVSGYDEIVLMLDEGSNTSLHLLEKIPERTKIVWVKKEGNGYIFQQYCKLTAHHHTNSEKIMFVDSDCMFTYPIDLSKLDTLPEMLYTHYDQVGDAICWKVCTEKVIRQNVEFEFMRRNGLIYHRSTLENFEKFVGELKYYVMNQNRFSEFNALGAYAWFYEHESYKWINTSTQEFNPPIVMQMWSHGEFNSDELDKTLNKYDNIMDKIADAMYKKGISELMKLRNEDNQQ